MSYANAIIILAAVAGGPIYTFGGDSSRLIELYILGVFTSFTLCQAGMVRHWNRELSQARDRARRRRVHRARAIDAFGACLTSLVLVVELVTKFTHAAYLVVIAMPVLYAMMRGIRHHYDRVSAELHPRPGGMVLPSRVHAVVLVSQLHRPTLRALGYARVTRPDTLTELTVQISPGEVEALLAEWIEREIPVPLTVMGSPSRDITGSVLEYIARLHRDHPHDLIAVYVPEYVVGRCGRRCCTTSRRFGSKRGCSSSAG